MAIPDAKFIGIRAEDYDRCKLTGDVKIALNDRDITRAKQIMDYPWFADKKPWKKEIKTMKKEVRASEIKAAKAEEEAVELCAKKAALS